MPTALITGITGQDGSYLAELLLEKGYRVVGVVRRSSTTPYERIGHLIDRVELVSADLLDQTSLTDAVHECQPDEIYKDRKSTRLNSSHLGISYAVFCLKKKSQYSTP